VPSRSCHIIKSWSRGVQRKIHTRRYRRCNIYKKYHMANIELQAQQQQQQAQTHGEHNNGNGNGHGNDGRPLEPEELRRRSNETMFDTHVMMPMDILRDNRNLYCVMSCPFAMGENYSMDVLERRQKFPEDDARYWFKQVLNGVS